MRAFADAGCRYLQLDEVNFTYLCDPKQRQIVIDRGDDPDALPAAYAGMINAAISDIPADMTITMHLCRGNFRSTFIASGGYEPVAELLFNAINVHGYFMEFDTERAGGFEPLRFVPKGKMVVLGLVTSKSGTLESKDELKRRIDQAAKFVPLDQLCLSPQCGFASSEEGNILAEEEQWAKLEWSCEIAEEVWGEITMKRTVPPFRADHVGSLLRPKALHEARAQARQRRDFGRRAQGGRRPGNRAHHQEAGGGRPAGDHRRRVPPLVVASRFSLGPRRRREARRWTPASPSPRSPRATKA